MEEKDKILYLESLRGIAASTVVIHHFDVDSILNNAFTKNGWLMVDFFFVLSGYVIALNYQNKIRKVSHIYNFQARRFLRLYPLHILMLFVFLGVEIGKFVAEIEFGLIANNQAFSINNLTSFFHNVFLVQNLVGSSSTWNGPSWSISSEFYTYIVFALTVLLTIQKNLLLVITSTLIAAASFYFLYTRSMAIEYGFVRCLYSFFLGVLTLNISRRVGDNLPNAFSYVMLVFSIYLVCISGPENQIGVNIFIPLVFVMLILSLTNSSGTNYLKSLLNNEFLVYLGTISYGIYMIHRVIWWGFSQTMRFVFDFPTHINQRGDVIVLIDNWLLSNLLIILGFGIIIGLAHYSYKFIEMPVNGFRHKLGRFG